MKEKNEYQKKAYDLLREVIKLPMVNVTTDLFEQRGEARTFTFSMCHVNGERYIIANDISSGFSSSVETLKKMGIIVDGDIRHFVCDKGKVQTCVKLSGIVHDGERLREYFRKKDFFEESKRVIPILEAAQKADLPEICIDSREWERSEEAYRERLDMLAESKKVVREQRIQEDLEYEREQKERRIEEGRKEERTLRDLVEQIEAMGWHVTLSLK